MPNSCWVDVLCIREAGAESNRRRRAGHGRSLWRRKIFGALVKRSGAAKKSRSFASLRMTSSATAF